MRIQVIVRDTHEDQSGVQVFVVLDKVAVVVVGWRPIVEFDEGAVRCSVEVLKERRQRFPHSI